MISAYPALTERLKKICSRMGLTSALVAGFLASASASGGAAPAAQNGDVGGSIRTAETPAKRVNTATIAVIIGNKDYRRDLPDVPFALNDARAMGRYVSEQMGAQARNVLALEDATLETMVGVLGEGGKGDSRLARMVQPGVSDVVVYFSGHGLPGLRDGRAYLMPVDADPEQPAATAFALDDLYESLGQLHARSVTLYLETSFTGRAPGGALINASPRIPPAVAPFDLADGIAVISAAQPEQMAAWDTENRHGLFTEYLLRGLYGAADVWGHGNGDGEVTLSEVKTYLDKEMTFAARRDHGRVQSADVSGVTDFVLGRFDPSDPPLRPLVDGRDVARAVVNEVPLPEDKVEQVQPILSDEAVEPLPLPDNKPLAADDFGEFENSEDPPIASTAPVVEPEPRFETAEEALWREVGQSNNPEDLKVYLLKYPDGRYVDVAKVRFRRLLDGLNEYAPVDRIEQLQARNERLKAKLRKQKRLRKLEAQNARLKRKLRKERRARKWRPRTARLAGEFFDRPPPPPPGWEFGPPPPRGSFPFPQRGERFRAAPQPLPPRLRRSF